MEITPGGMSVEELQLQFSQKQDTTASTTTKVKTEDKLPENMEELLKLGLSSDELAEKIKAEKEIKQSATEGEDKAPKKTKEVPVAVEQLDETFINKFDEALFKKNVLNPFLSEDGESYIVPKNMDELAEVITANIEDRIAEVKNTEKQTLLNEVFQESSPALQFILSNANNFRSPEDLLPLINSVQQQDNFADLDPANEDHQVYIIQNALILQGLDGESIKEEIADLKERGKLQSRAEKLKPALEKYSADQTEAILAEQEKKNQEDQKFWGSYFSQMNQDLIEAKDLDGMKLKAEHKNVIANMIVPNQKLGGLPLYSVIDEMVGKGDIRKLSKVALLLADEKAFDNYYGTRKANDVAQGAQRLLRQSIKSSSSENAQDETIQKQQASQRPKYGNFLGQA